MYFVTNNAFASFIFYAVSRMFSFLVLKRKLRNTRNVDFQTHDLSGRPYNMISIVLTVLNKIRPTLICPSELEIALNFSFPDRTQMFEFDTYALTTACY